MTRAPRSCDLPESVIDDRVSRYVDGEPLRVIAEDHGVTIPAILHTVKRHAPGAYESGRVRGPRSEWRA